MNNGIENEYNFVKLFNEKKYNELDNNSKIFIKDLFPNIKDDDFIVSWKNKLNQKNDIYIKTGNNVRGISIKTGEFNSIHQESIQDFRMFLYDIGIPNDIIEYYISYQYGYLRENGKRNKDVLLNSDEYKSHYQNELDIFNKSLNSTKKIIQCIDRFIIRGRNSNYDIDAIVHGEPDNYIWLLKDDIYDLILFQRNNITTSPHIGNLTIGPKARGLIDNVKYNKDRYVITVKWMNMKDDIIAFKKYKNNNL